MSILRLTTDDCRDEQFFIASCSITTLYAKACLYKTQLLPLIVLPYRTAVTMTAHLCLEFVNNHQSSHVLKYSNLLALLKSISFRVKSREFLQKQSTQTSIHFTLDFLPENKIILSQTNRNECIFN